MAADAGDVIVATNKRSDALMFVVKEFFWFLSREAANFLIGTICYVYCKMKYAVLSRLEFCAFC